MRASLGGGFLLSWLCSVWQFRYGCCVLAGGTDAPAPTTPDAAAGGVGDDDGGGSVGGDADVSAAREIPPVFSNDDISTSSDQDATSSMSNNLT